MRVLFTVSSWPTHYASMVPIGWALQAAAHDVRVLCTPSQADPLSMAGLTPVPVLDSPDDQTRLRLQYYLEAVHGHWPYPWPPLHPLTGAPMDSLDDFDLGEFRERQAPAIAGRAAASFDTAVEFARAYQPDLILHDPANLEGQLAARVIGVPGVLCLWGPVGATEPEHMRIVPDDISDSFPRYGLGPFDPATISTVIDPCPPGVAVPTAARRLSVRYVPYNGSGAAPRWLLDPVDQPRVCVTWSTALASMSGPRAFLLPEIVRAVSELDVEVVLTATARDVAALGPVPSHIRVLEHLPLRLVLPTCSAVVHHGGSGSTLTSLWSGVPQLLPTFASEQNATGRRMAAAGAAVHLLGHLANASTMHATLEKLLADDSYTVAARRLRDEMHAQPTPADLVSELTALG
ncbi:MAG TPA: nucleotide disphospho-sugar-binding domain-containing protein [Rugosimonospora sp.]|nr:nucleotide disphospho-sugar-binding domain-containing protein [Rugosimonospora sp.]